MNAPQPQPGSRTEWVATPPGPARPRRRARRSRPYTGPPSYPAVPRWGFPQLAWRWPLALPNAQRVDPVERLHARCATAVATLWLTAGLAVVASLAEVWRYVLLLRSRSEALPRTSLAVSDALVATTGVMTWLFGLLSGVVVVLWALRARAFAHERAGVRPARPDWQFLTGVLVPGLNLFVPGSVLAELEHTALLAEGARDVGTRPSPSRMVRFWWAAWVAGLLFGWGTFLWGFRGGVQAMADGVVLHAITDAVVVALAVVTVVVVRRLTRLLTPVDTASIQRERVVAVRGAPKLSRAPRPTDAVR